MLILWGAVVEHGFPTQNWITYRQAFALGGNVRRGEHGTTVVYADRFVPDHEKKRARETGEDKRRVCRLAHWRPAIGALFEQPASSFAAWRAFSAWSQGDDDAYRAWTNTFKTLQGASQ